GARGGRVLLPEERLTTVCEEARCPNLGECFSRGTATFMLLGDRCTRRCGYCAVSTAKPLPPDPEEPARVAGGGRRAARDDAGASPFAGTVNAVRRVSVGAKVEVLTPDFRGDDDALQVVL